MKPGADEKFISDFKRKNLEKLAKEVLKTKGICDHCIGRQFAQLSTGMSNSERGGLVRELLKKQKNRGKCPVCNGFFAGVGRTAEKIVKSLKGVEWKTFVVGTIAGPESVEREESLWERTGIEFCEPMKSEVNRELGKAIEKLTGKLADEKAPDVTFTLELDTGMISARTSPLLFYGEYQKLVRGIPQSKWDKYEVSVEDIMAEPFMKAAKAAGHAIHAAGREDIDARCLGWRPFILEIYGPKVRSLDIKALENAVNSDKRIKIRGLKASRKAEIAKLKSMRADKSYRALAEFSRPLKGLKKLSGMAGVISQQTPTRVKHRRADKMRKRRLKAIQWKKAGPQKLELLIRGEAGLYIKELVTGDSGRTKPSVAEVLGNPAKVLELDVIEIHVPGHSGKKGREKGKTGK
jgi:tRNA pseudouridine synthase 10